MTSNPYKYLWELKAELNAIKRTPRDPYRCALGRVRAKHNLHGMTQYQVVRWLETEITKETERLNLNQFGENDYASS